jgi:hypothetical protein
MYIIWVFCWPFGTNSWVPLCFWWTSSNFSCAHWTRIGRTPFSAEHLNTHSLAGQVSFWESSCDGLRPWKIRWNKGMVPPTASYDSPWASTGNSTAETDKVPRAIGAMVFHWGVSTWKSKLQHFFYGFSICEAGHPNSEHCGFNLDLSWRLSRTLADSRKSRRSNTPQWAAGWGKSHSKDLRKFWQQAQEWFPVQSSYSKIWITQEDRDETSKKSDVLLGWRGDLYSASCRIYRGCDKRMVVITHFSHQPTQIQDIYWQGYCIQTLQVLRWGPVPKILQNQGWKPGRARTMS